MCPWSDAPEDGCALLVTLPACHHDEKGEPAMSPMRQVLLADGKPADAVPAREASAGGRFQSCGI
jgi:hypothetical protein